VRLVAADVSDLDAVLNGRRFDLFLCCGVLMYCGPESSQRLVRTMLEHARRRVVISGLAHPEIDNAQIDTPSMRERDGTFIHNIDAMVERAGGQVMFRRWEGSRSVDGNTIYFLICRPPGGVTE
jgi:O-methyltransferase involved in polyketide biosynthesis